MDNGKEKRQENWKWSGYNLNKNKRMNHFVLSDSYESEGKVLEQMHIMVKQVVNFANDLKSIRK